MVSGFRFPGLRGTKKYLLGVELVELSWIFFLTREFFLRSHFFGWIKTKNGWKQQVDDSTGSCWTGIIGVIWRELADRKSVV